LHIQSGSHFFCHEQFCQEMCAQVELWNWRVDGSPIVYPSVVLGIWFASRGLCFNRMILFFLEFVLLHWGSFSFLCAVAAVLTWQIECFHIFILHVKNMSTISGFPFLHFSFFTLFLWGLL
jgi:hypothetical protein